MASPGQVENTLPRKRGRSGGTSLWGHLGCVQEEVQAPVCTSLVQGHRDGPLVHEITTWGFTETSTSQEIAQRV